MRGRLFFIGGRMRQVVLIFLLCLLWQGGTASAGPNTGCQDPDIERAVEEALEQINAERHEGYILTLNGVYDVSRESKGDGGSLVNLTLHVLETQCHVISRKRWKTCLAKQAADVPAIGICEASLSVQKNFELQNYNCIIQKVPATVILDICPDCPTEERLDDPIIEETANLSLEKFNKESGYPNQFALVNITGASMQWVVGPVYFVDFTIQELDCAKVKDGSAPPQCQVLGSGSARRGFCNGSHTSTGDDPVGVTCEIYEPEGANQGQREINGEKDKAASSRPLTLLGTVRVLPSPSVMISPKTAPVGRGCPGPLRHKPSSWLRRLMTPHLE